MIKNAIYRQDIEQIIDSDINWECFRNKSILVTGASGFLPTYIVYTLLVANDKFNLNLNVTGLVRSDQKIKLKYEGFINSPSFNIIVQDVSNPILNRKYNFIIHAASQASPKYYSSDPVGTLKPNIIGTINLMELAVSSKAESVLYFSSSEVYGQVEESLNPIQEDQFGYLDPVKVRSCYAESKRMGETICTSYYHQYSVPVKIVRPFHTYGPGMDLDDGRVFADFVKNIVRGNDIIMTSDGSAKRAFCYLTDATIGFLKVLISGKNGEAYNIGNEKEEYSIKELANILVNLVPEKRLKTIFSTAGSENYIPSNVSRNCPDCTKIHKLGWSPKVTVKEGFTRTIESYK